MKHFLFTVCGIATILGMTEPVHAQIMGHHISGTCGLLSGSQNRKGFILAPLYTHYSADKFMDGDGNELPNPSGQKRDVSINGFGLFFCWVSNYKILGANYGLLANIPIGNVQVEFASFNFETGFGLADSYLQPVNLGWHLKQVDFIASYGVYFPIGRYKAGAKNNNGMGMWTHEFGAGTTLFFDAQKRWHFATSGYFEMNGKKQDSGINVGNTLTLEGGVGRSFYMGALVVGVVYYANWKMSNDKISLNSPFSNLPTEDLLKVKHRVYGMGPEVNLPVVIKGKLISLLKARYYWELGTRSTLEGQRLEFFIIFPFLATQGK
ncbi:MAG: transporter [Deltaproteobacteria bacterium]|nr:transporter [Deltaproteobacteria bacterium]